ncbi:hypothetical protein [bacterium endosymbiont of Bathymodiolus sp. 5 South]|jgi:hypothetical protein|uniref:hypothetical protein n=1 Tax=bacterium endosymbiont of Bathymodiolus sp. 5 South TaxID=1181670 RepID=UPI00111B8151|nr:hypothetical protein [bacterium endosymbiont of Bathymodiolus sp. 5 South]VVH56528.1 hypothetical protein BSPCLSOX_1213 [uncultured Gammaproteobacteria bacterium]
MHSTWEEINSFQSMSEYKRFVIYIEKQVEKQYAVEIEVCQNYKKNEIYGGRWFKDLEAKEIWRLVEPDFPFRGHWEKVDN